MYAKEAPSEDDSSLLVLILDTNPFVWNSTTTRRDEPFEFEDAVKHILVFINAYLALMHDNRLAVIASHAGQSSFLYPAAEPTHVSGKPSGAGEGYEEVPERETRLRRNPHQSQNANEYRAFKQIDDQILEQLRRLVDDVDTPLKQVDKKSSMMAGALSLALCYINRIAKADDSGKIKSRICVISVSMDSALQYIPVMNSIFSAQKMMVPIDVCKLFDEESIFLQQAAYLTGGIYKKVEKPSGLLQHLLYTFLRDQYSRSLLKNPGENHVDFRAACFCHKKIIDVGHVCSVCLSIFCEFSPVCSTCRTKFAFKALLRPSSGAIPRRGARTNARGSNAAGESSRRHAIQPKAP